VGGQAVHRHKITFK